MPSYSASRKEHEENKGCPRNMASTKFDKKTFEKEIGKLTQELQEKITSMGTPIEGITDTEVEIDVTPNRPDLFSYQGFKRNFLAFIGKKKGLPKYTIKKPEKNFEVKIDPSVKEVRPYTACAIVKKLNFNDEKIKEIIDIQEKLHTTVGRKRKKVAIGIYPLEKITLPITFKALEPEKIKFLPLESEREMTGKEILLRHPTGKEYANLLEGYKKYPIFVDAKGQILSMPPIINSELTGRVSENTKEVFIECSGSDFKTLKKCLNIIITALADMGGEIYSMKLTGAPEKTSPDLTPEENKISLDNVNKQLGLNLKEKEMSDLLSKMNHEYKNKKVLSPAYRTDILHEVDLIEDIAIAYGYDNLIPEIPQIATIGKENPKEIIKRKMCDILTGLGMLEISSLHLTTIENQFTKMGIEEKNASNYIEVEESKTENNILRKNLSHFIMKVFGENVDREYPQRIFEMGRVFYTDNGKIIETENLSIGLTPGNSTEVKQILNYLGKMLAIEFKIKEPTIKPEFLIDGRIGAIELNGKEIGFFGEVHPKTLREWKTKMPVSILEINLEEIYKSLI